LARLLTTRPSAASVIPLSILPRPVFRP